ncbi:TPA: hypothetical protein QDB06_000873 [Burkholderia vietnamiensis]|nr:hypothetical protein [Burkholderia vietnamiensis]
MASICDNGAMVYGDPVELKKFVCRHFSFVTEEGKGKKVFIQPNDLEDRKGIKVTLDCNTVIPMPDELNCEATNEYRYSQEEFRYVYEDAPKRLYKMLETLWTQQVSNLEKHGYAHWFDFQNSEWGQPGGAFDGFLKTNLKEGSVSFYYMSSWGPLFGIMKKLIEMYPQFKFEFEYEHSDKGFCGEYFGSNGVVTRDVYEEVDDEN